MLIPTSMDEVVQLTHPSVLPVGACPTQKKNGRHKQQSVFVLDTTTRVATINEDTKVMPLTFLNIWEGG